MVVTDTPFGVFDKISLDTVGMLPMTPNGNRHILTMQDNFTKFCLTVLEESRIVLTNSIKHYVEDYDEWDRLLTYARCTYNTSVHVGTNFAPFELTYGWVARIPSSFPPDGQLEIYGSYFKNLIIKLEKIRTIASKNLIKAKEHSKDRYEEKLRPLNAKIGDRVIVRKDTRDEKFNKRTTRSHTIVGFTDINNEVLKTESGARFANHANKLVIVYC